MLIPTLRNIVQLAAGTNHILAMDNKGSVVGWGCGQQNQLGRRVIERSKLTALTPRPVGLPKNKVAQIACGSYHSFAIDRDGAVWAWGLNNFAETGIETGAGLDNAVILKPTKVESLAEYAISHIAGGEHHSVACTASGSVLTWGKADGGQCGLPKDKLTPENSKSDENGVPRILIRPEPLPRMF